jgi:hypothetical protein
MENDMDTSVEQKIKGRFHLLIFLSIISVLVSILSMVLVVRINMILTIDRNERRAREFVEKIIYSMNFHTDYYKYHCSKDVISNIDEGSINEVTSNYRIVFIDVSTPYYDYDLTFDGKNRYRVEVAQWSEGNLEIVLFDPILK